MAINAMTPGRLATVLLTTTTQALFTVPAGQIWRVLGASIVNTSSAEATYTLWAPGGGAPSDANLLSEDKAVAGGGTPQDVSSLLRQDFEAGFSLHGKSNTDNVLTLTVSGTRFTEVT